MRKLFQVSLPPGTDKFFLVEHLPFVSSGIREPYHALFIALGRIVSMYN